MSSASRQPPNYHLIGHGTVPSICCLDTNSPRVEYIHCPSRSARLWRSTFRRFNQGYIRPSSLPAASSFFFVGKKDGGLRPCIDYRALNSQMVKLPYPLPLVPAALEELRGHAFCLSWTCEVRITLFGSRKTMSGRRHSLLLQAITSTSLCPSPWPMPPPSSRNS